ncbi:MAG: hypothetical protein RO257_07675 [Candidatus Kapabacteria bacterium]|nr:hypothetical protein [Candidatus Kapabacteria bacterium]
MKKILSVFFNTDRTYLTGLTIGESGISLDYINSTTHPIDFGNIESNESKNGMNELETILLNMNFKPDEISITLPSESVLVTKFPGREDISDDELNQLLNLEIRQIYPDRDNSEFTTYAVPLIPEKQNLQQMLAVIVKNEIIKEIENIVKVLDKPIVKYEISQLTAHTGFLHNYPELNDKCVLFFSLQSQFIEVSVLQNGKPVYYNLVGMPDNNQTVDLFEREFAKIVPDYVPVVDASFFFGAGLTKSVSQMLSEKARFLGINEAKRLNAFRMIQTNLSKRENDYCSRTFHIFPACIGGCLPAQYKRITV